MTFLSGKKTFITGAVMVLVALAQYFGIIDVKSDQFNTIMGGLTGLAAVFLRLGMTK